MVKDAFSSGMPIAEFARMVEMVPSVLFKWRKAFIKAGDMPPLPNWHPEQRPSSGGEDAFVCIGNTPPSQDATIRIQIGSDVVIECSAAVDPLQVAKLVRALRPAPASEEGGAMGRQWRPLR